MVTNPTCVPAHTFTSGICVCAAQFPFALPQIPTFRDITGTQGVDQYALSYHNYCHGEGSATQVTADSIEALGIDPRSENPLLPNAAVLRAAEAVDSIMNAADAGSPDVENSINAGRVLCSICQLGGLIYFTLLGIIVLVLVNFLPLVNLISQLLFDGCVACTDAVTAKGLPRKLKRPPSLSKAPSVRIKGKATGASAAATSASTSSNVSNANLTAQQLRSLKRKQRLASGPDTTSFASRARQLGQCVASRFGGATEPLEEASLLPQKQAVSPLSPQETWA